MPLTLNISDLNGSEKYYNLSDTLPVNSEKAGNIKKKAILCFMVITAL